MTFLIAGNRAESTRIVKALLEGPVDIRELFVDLFQKSLYEVGHLWETNRLSVVREHLVTAITEGLLNLVYPTQFLEKNAGKTVVISWGPTPPWTRCCTSSAKSNPILWVCP
ncbi:MAG: B12-binding domain-containing protein [Pseudomonadota bacterium]